MDQSTALARSIERDRKMIDQPAEWPRWPVLPLKRRDGQFHDPGFCGFIVEGQATRLFFGNIWRLNEEADKAGGTPTWGEVLARFDHRDFASVDDLIAEYTVD